MIGVGCNSGDGESIIRGSSPGRRYRASRGPHRARAIIIVTAASDVGAVVVKRIKVITNLPGR